MVLISAKLPLSQQSCSTVPFNKTTCTVPQLKATPKCTDLRGKTQFCTVHYYGGRESFVITTYIQYSVLKIDLGTTTKINTHTHTHITAGLVVGTVQKKNTQILLPLEKPSLLTADFLISVLSFFSRQMKRSTFFGLCPCTVVNIVLRH